MSEPERMSLGMTILKWLAPLSAGTILGYLIVRASTCEEAPEPRAEPQVVAAPPLLEPPPQPSAAPPPHDAGTPKDPMQALGELMGDHLMGSKSGFQGLGLRGSGRRGDASVPSLGEIGAPGTNRAQGEGFLGGSKSGTLSPLEREARMKEAAVEPAVEEERAP